MKISAKTVLEFTINYAVNFANLGVLSDGQLAKGVTTFIGTYECTIRLNNCIYVCISESRPNNIVIHLEAMFDYSNRTWKWNGMRHLLDIDEVHGLMCAWDAVRNTVIPPLRNRRP